MELKKFRATKLDIAYFELGEQHAPVIFLLHGWPDDATAWQTVGTELVANNFRVIIPFLRGFGSTAFNDSAWPRDGSSVALVQDVIDLADGLHIDTFNVAGHDWGARAAYQLAILFPQRIKAIAALALGYQPYGEFKMPDFIQAKNFWYQWLMMVDAGAAAISKDPIGFARIQWDTWSPAGWYTEADFEHVAASFKNPDWLAITLNGYRRRFQWAESDPDYADHTRRINSTANVTVPTLMIQGGADTCDLPAQSAGLENHFESGYKRIILPDVGHFPMREAPKEVLAELLAHFKKWE